MAFLNHKNFLYSGRVKESFRPEAKMKSVESNQDLRAWCGNVEDRRQHILELTAKNIGVSLMKVNIHYLILLLII